MSSKTTLDQFIYIDLNCFLFLDRYIPSLPCFAPTLTVLLLEEFLKKGAVLLLIE